MTVNYLWSPADCFNSLFSLMITVVPGNMHTMYSLHRFERSMPSILIAHWFLSRLGINYGFSRDKFNWITSSCTCSYVCSTCRYQKIGMPNLRRFTSIKGSDMFTRIVNSSEIHFMVKIVYGAVKGLDTNDIFKNMLIITYIYYSSLIG